MKAAAKFDIANYLATHSAQEKVEISNLTKLAVGFKEHNDESKNLSDQDVIQLLSQTTYKTGLSAQQFWRFCDAYDIADIYADRYSLEQLSAYAKSWVRYPEIIPEGNAQIFPTLEPKSVPCKQCQHFIPDQIGDGTGIGSCNINAVKSKKTLFPNRTNFCLEYNPL